MSEPNKLLGKNFRVFFWIAVIFAAIFLIVRNIGIFGNILLVMIGFGAVILVHEFGHFIAAKLSGIKVEAFSIGFPPILLGVLRTERGWRIRILPQFFKKGNDESCDGGLSFTIGKKTKAGETEYRIGLIPLGGFVKMLGQEDVGQVEKSDDPRSYANKSVGARMAVIASGVLFNAISAIIVFVAVFLVGIELPPAVVGGVIANSPAARAGLTAGDKIIEINGKNDDLDFSSISLAAALSDVNETVKLKVEHKDGSVEELGLVAEQLSGSKMRLFGVMIPMSLTVGKVSDANALFERIGLLPGDKVRSVNGQDVQAHWEFEEIVENSLVPEVAVLAEREREDGSIEKVETQLRLEMSFADSYAVENESELFHICSMVPRLRITAYLPPSQNKLAAVFDEIKSFLNKTGTGKAAPETGPALKSGDVVLAIGDVENPTYKEMRDVITRHKELGDFVRRYTFKGLIDLVADYKERDPCNISRRYRKIDSLVKSYEEMRAVVADFNEQAMHSFVARYEDEDLSLKVLRADGNGLERPITVSVTPRRLHGRVVIGVLVELDVEHPIVARSIETENGPEKLGIPRGAVITKFNEVGVSSFYDLIREIRSSTGRQVTIDYRLGKETFGDVVLDLSGDKELVTVKSTLAEFIPFEGLEKCYKADNPFEAMVMGYRKTIMFIVQTYLTIKRLISRAVDIRALSGPVGIITMSYRIVAYRPPVYYIYFLGLISACIAVFNFLPLLPLDGGHIVLLLIEKVKGSALNVRAQEFMAYAGWVLIGALFLYITFNDVVTNFFAK